MRRLQIRSAAAATGSSTCKAWVSPVAFCALRTRGTVKIFSVKRARQYVPRKELQKQAKLEYLKQFYESADRIEPDHLVYQLKPSSPRVRAQQQQHVEHALLNQQLAQQIPHLATWQQLQEFMQQHSSSVHFLNVLALAGQAVALYQGYGPPADHSLIQQLAALTLQHASWFQPAHFASAAVNMCEVDLEDATFWENLAAAAEHKVGAFSFQQLSQVLEAFAIVGFTPNLQWIERCYRQASKHLHAAAPGDVCVLMWAWAEMGYTPRDRLFMNQVKIITRRAFDIGGLTGIQMVQLLHGLARMPKYAPNPGWLLAFAREVEGHMQHLPPGDVVDMMLCMVALEFKPPEPWMDAALAQLQHGLLSSSSSSSDSGAGGGSRAGTLLLLPPADMLGLVQASSGHNSPAGGIDPGLLLAADDAYGDLQDLEQLQGLFEEAAMQSQDSSDWEQSDEDKSNEQADMQPQGLRGSSQQPLTTAGAIATARPVNQSSTGIDSTSSSQSSAILQRQLRQQQQLNVERLAVLCWCLGQLDFQPNPDWMQLLGQALLQQHKAATAEVLVDVLLGLVSIGYMPVGHLQQAWLSRTVHLVPVMHPEGLRRLCQALGDLERGLAHNVCTGAFAAGLAVVQQCNGTVSQQQVAEAGSTPVAADTSYLQQYQQQHKQHLAEAIAHRQGIILWQSTTQQLAEVFAYFAATCVKPSLEYMATAVSRAVARIPEGASAPSLCTLLWALARLGFKPHPQLLHQILAALQRGLHSLSGQDLADAAWALCTLKHRPGTVWLNLYMHEVRSKAAYMAPQALTDTLWALACFAAQPDREWLKGAVSAVGKHVAAGELPQRNAAVVVWALQQLGFQPQQMLAGQIGSGAGVAAAATAGIESALLGLIQAVTAQPVGV